MDCVGHEGDGGKCWAVVDSLKVLGSTYTPLDFYLLMESVGHYFEVGKCWTLIKDRKVLNTEISKLQFMGTIVRASI